MRAPVGACDAHLTLPGGLSDAGVGARAAPMRFEDWLSLARDHLDSLGCNRAVIVGGGADATVTSEAVRRLGDHARGVVAVAPDALDHAFDELERHHIHGVQVDLTRDGGLDWDQALALVPRLAEHGMILEVALHADRDLPARAGDIAALDLPVVVQHCGWPADAAHESVGMQSLRKLLAEDKVWVKLSGPERFTQDARTAGPLIQGLVAANPGRCVWGSDWPHLASREDSPSDSGVLFDMFCNLVEDPETRQRILVDNPARLYGF